jgi:hypothetical protein
LRLVPDLAGKTARVVPIVKCLNLCTKKEVFSRSRSQIISEDVGFAFGARSGWKNSQGGANSEVSEPKCQVVKDVNQLVEGEYCPV